MNSLKMLSIDCDSFSTFPVCVIMLVKRKTDQLSHFVTFNHVHVGILSLDADECFSFELLK